MPWTFALVKKPAAKGTAEGNPGKTSASTTDWSRFNNHTWTLVLEDSPFELATQPLSFARMLDVDYKVGSYEAKGNIAMSSETYRRIDSWNVMWRQRR